MRRFRYFVEDLTTRKQSGELETMKAAKAVAKAHSLETGHVAVVVAVDSRSGDRHPQGAYYGRTWRGGAHHLARDRNRRGLRATRERWGAGGTDSRHRVLHLYHVADLDRGTEHRVYAANAVEARAAVRSGRR